MSFDPKVWHDYPNTTTPITAAALVDLETRVTDYADAVVQDSLISEWDIRNFGAIGDGVSDDTEAIQDALTAASVNEGAGLIIPELTFVVTDELVLPFGVNVYGRGQRSQLWWPDDLGADKYGIRIDDPTYAANVITDLRLTGPGTNTALGTAPCDMDGIQISSNVVVNRSKAEWFRSGGVFMGNHAYVNQSWFTKCYYGLYWGDPTDSGPTYDNNYVINTIMDGEKMASVGVAPNNILTSVGFKQCHLGFSPYAIYSEDSRTEDVAVNLMLDTCALEQTGNGVFFDEDDNSDYRWQGITMLGCTEYGTFNPTYKINARDTDFAYKVAGAVNWNIISNGASGACFGHPGDIASFHAEYASNFEFDNAETIINSLVAAQKPLGDNYMERTRLRGGHEEYIQAWYQWPDAGYSPVAGQLAELEGDAEPYGFLSSPPVGVNAITMDAPCYAILQVKGDADVLTSDATLNAKGLYVKPDEASTEGEVVKATDANDGPIIGYTLAAKSGDHVHCRLLMKT
jgi:pectate lyase-like protein